MEAFPRREISEIIEIASREAGIVSLFVEGNFDRDIFEKYVREKGLDQFFSVYPIDTIDVPDQILAELGFGLSSNKARVMALASAVSRASQDVISRVFCVVDADCDRVLGKLENIPALRYTDFTCMEMYAFSENILSDICEFSFNLEKKEILAICELMDAVLPTMFALRCCNEELDLNATMPMITSGFEKKRNNRNPEFVQDKYVRLFVEQNKIIPRMKEVLDLFKLRFDKLDKDIRHKSHGHDAIKILFHYLNQRGIASLKSDQIDLIGNRILIGGMSINRLDNFKLFENLKIMAKLSMSYLDANAV